MGKVDDGSSNFDYDRRRSGGRSRSAPPSITTFWDKVEVTLADTPGYIQLRCGHTGPASKSWTAAILVVKRRLRRGGPDREDVELARGDVPVIAFVSKMDRERPIPRRRSRKITDILKVPACRCSCRSVRAEFAA